MNHCVLAPVTRLYYLVGLPINYYISVYIQQTQMDRHKLYYSVDERHEGQHFDKTRYVQ